MPSHRAPNEPPRIARAHAFVVRDGRILVLEQATGARWSETPGGTLEPGETPDHAIVREVLEETGLRITSPQLLREWQYENRRGDIVDCYTYAASVAYGDVVLSDEHTRFEWLTAEEYVELYCADELAMNAALWVAPSSPKCAKIAACCASGSPSAIRSHGRGGPMYPPVRPTTSLEPATIVARD